MRAHDEHGKFHDVGDLHRCRLENDDQVPTQLVHLSFDVRWHGTIRPEADFSGGMQHTRVRWNHHAVTIGIVERMPGGLTFSFFAVAPETIRFGVHTYLFIRRESRWRDAARQRLGNPYLRLILQDHLRSTAVTLISTAAPGTASTVVPMPVHAGKSFLK